MCIYAYIIMGYFLSMIGFLVLVVMPFGEYFEKTGLYNNPLSFCIWPYYVFRAFVPKVKKPQIGHSSAGSIEETLYTSDELIKLAKKG